MARNPLSSGSSSSPITADDSNNDETTDNKTWTIHYDKEGITLEDALPIVQLSRQRKDKRVFGVFGLPKRNNSRKERGGGAAFNM